MKNIYKIKGMHCKSCEIFVENKIKEIENVTKVSANSKKGTLLIYSENSIESSKVIDAVNAAGYEVGSENIPYFQATIWDIVFILSSILILWSASSIIKNTGFTDFFNFKYGSGTNIFTVLMVGITAGLSTCMALVGGLVLGISARHAEKNPSAGALEKFKPHLYFNLGRIISFILLGGLIGMIGSSIKFSPAILGIMTIFVGVVMLFLGIQLLEIFPKINTKFVLPKWTTKFLIIKNKEGKEYSHFNSMIIGGLSFFLPCGFTQAMQIYAISTGGFFSGAIIMGVFALGTTPGLLGIGGLTSIIKKGEISRLFFKFIGVLVIGLALYNFSNGLNLTGFSRIINNKNTKVDSVGVKTSTAKVIKVLDTQNFRTTYNPDNFDQTINPNEFTVQLGKKVNIEIFAKEDGQGCMGSVMIPGLINEPKYFIKDEKVNLEFTPQKKGTYKLTCAMGIPSGVIYVK